MSSRNSRNSRTGAPVQRFDRGWFDSQGLEKLHRPFLNHDLEIRDLEIRELEVHKAGIDNI
jgi:hypothetical protein